MTNGTDLTDQELEQLYDEIDREIAEKGLPTDEEIFAEIERLNQSAPGSAQPG